METLVSNAAPAFVQTHQGHDHHRGGVVVVGSHEHGLAGKDAAFISGIDVTRKVGQAESNLMGTLLRSLQEVSVNIERTNGFNALTTEKSKAEITQNLGEQINRTQRQVLRAEQDAEKRHAEVKELIQKMENDRIKQELADVKLKYELDARFNTVLAKLPK